MTTADRSHEMSSHLATTSGSSTGTDGRLRWADALRGLAVLLVVLLHVPVIPLQIGAQPPEELHRWQWSLQPFRMPTLLLLSGLLLDTSLRKGVRRYTQGKARGILWPYALWTLLTALALRDLAALTEITTWVLGYRHLWFLMVLAFCYALGLMTRWVPAWIMAVGLALAAIGSYALAGDAALGKLITHYCWWASFFFIGAALKPWIPRIQSVSAVVAGMAALPVAAWAVYVVADSEARWSRHIHSHLLSLLGVLLLVWVAGRIRWPSWLEWVGRKSIVWYVVHGAAIGGTWLVLDALGITSWWILTPLLLAAGYLIPLALAPLSSTALFRWSKDTPPILSGRS